MAEKIIRYVVGFYFDGSVVFLIRKNRPEWQTGKLNGIGGHIEPMEKSVEAMRREFREETGVDISEDRWHNFAIYRGQGWEVHFYTSDRKDEDPAVRTVTDETVGPVWYQDLPKTVIPNLHWLIPMACPFHSQPADWPFIIEEKGERNSL
jgi:8-oxo-dGTP diphosphatase